MLASVGVVLVLGTVACGQGDGGEQGAADRETVPATVLETLDGDELRLTDYRGRPVVVNFFANWCTPCVTEMPAFEQVHRQLGDEVAFVGISVQETVEEARAIATRTGVTYDLAREPQGELIRALGGVGMPTTVLVDAEGGVVDTHTGELSAEELTEMIESELLS